VSGDGDDFPVQDVQERVVAYLEAVDPEEVTQAARRHQGHGEAVALALGRIERARIAAEGAGDGEAVDVLLQLRDRELAGG
jgi:hypothetical protein